MSTEFRMMTDREKQLAHSALAQAMESDHVIGFICVRRPDSSMFLVWNTRDDGVVAGYERTLEDLLRGGLYTSSVVKTPEPV